MRVKITFEEWQNRWRTIRDKYLRRKKEHRKIKGADIVQGRK